MERLLILRLRSTGCAAEARLNDIPVARTPAAGGMVSMPVHEYLLEGVNQLTLVLDPPPMGTNPAPRLLQAPIGASLRLLLPRVGHLGSESTARTLAELDHALHHRRVGKIQLQGQTVRCGKRLAHLIGQWKAGRIADVDGAVQPGPQRAASIPQLPQEQRPRRRRQPGPQQQPDHHQGMPCPPHPHAHRPIPTATMRVPSKGASCPKRPRFRPPSC